jgi:hypothetical protein
MDNKCLTAGAKSDLHSRIDYSRTGRKQHTGEDMRTKPCLTSADAQKMMAACKAEAEKNKWKVSIAIVDDAGVLLHLERMEGAGPTTPEVAHGKARTAALTKQPTRLWEEARQGATRVPELSGWALDLGRSAYHLSERMRRGDRRVGGAIPGRRESRERGRGGAGIAFSGEVAFRFAAENGSNATKI